MIPLRIYLYSFITGILVFISGIAFSQSEKLSLQQAIEVGLKNNYSVLIAKNEAEILKNNNNPGNAGFLPSVNLNANTNSARNNTKQDYSSGLTVDKSGVKSTTLNSNALFSWTLFDGLKMFITHEKLSLLEAEGALNLKSRMESTVGYIILSYSDIIRQKEGLDYTGELLKLSEERMQIAEKQFNLGYGSKLNYLQAKVDKNAAKSAFLKQELAYKTSMTSLNVLLSRPPETNFEVSDSLVISYSTSLGDLLKNAATRNTSISQLELNKDLSKLSIKEIASNRYPKIVLNSGYTFSNTENQAGFLLSSRNLGWSYGLGISLPIFNGFNLQTQVKNARLSAIGSDLMLNEAKLQLNGDLMMAFQEFQQNLEILKMELENIVVARENLNLAMERYKTGTIDALELKQAENSFMESGLRLQNSRFNAKASEVNLMRLNGDLIK
jgi:outer membrane protein TolC